ncbi:heterokaryon incompatibility protein Het-C domain-containing protein, partial [Trichoderma chlorosporum]
MPLSCLVLFSLFSSAISSGFLFFSSSLFTSLLPRKLGFLQSLTISIYSHSGSLATISHKHRQFKPLLQGCSAMIDFRAPGFLLGLVLLVCLVQPAAAFGAGNIASISKVEGQNWRHGDIEDALLTLAMAHAIKGGRKFNKRTVSRVYFGNWLRDYSQAIDVATVKMVSAEAIRLLLCVLGFMSFGYGSGEFEVTAERLGCYRPEDHIDNPKGYAEGLDARDFDPRLRGPIDERVELAVDHRTGMKNYIANERVGIMTSARHVRKLFGRCIQLGREYKRSKNKTELYEALRLMGTGLHCLEDFFAHSNYTELALIEMGERGIFPHVGRNTQIELEGARGPVYPIVTGTFGGVDFLHSVTGEISDKLTQNELDELEGALNEGKTGDTSLLQSLLSNLPPGIIGGNQGDKVDELQSNASAAHEETVPVSPKDPEEFTIYIQHIYRQIMPVIEFHDSIMKSISGAIENIPILPQLIEQLEEQLSIFVFSIMAPFIVPLIHQIKNELQTGSSEIIESSKKEQHIVFDDDDSSDPTHSMLSKDHFSNILNEIAGRTAARMLHWVVPQLMEAIDDDSVDVDRLLERIVTGVMHHPAQRGMGYDGATEARQLIFNSVQEWWREMDDEQREDYRRKLSPRGVLNGENHKEGVHDTGHGCSGKLKMRKEFGEPQGAEDQIAGAAATALFSGATGVLSGLVSQNTGIHLPFGQQQQSGGDDGIGGLISGMAGSLLGGGFEQGSTRREISHETEEDGSYTQHQREYGQQGGRYGQAEYSQTYHPDGGRESSYQRSEQQGSYGSRGYGTSSYEQRQETHESSYVSYEERTERREYHSRENSYGGGYEQRRSDSRGSNDSRKRHSHGSHQHRHHQSRDDGSGRGHSRRDDDDDGYERREEDSYGSNVYGRREEDSYGGEYGSRGESGHGRRHRHHDDDDEADDSQYKVRDHGGSSGAYRF